MSLAVAMLTLELHRYGAVDADMDTTEPDTQARADALLRRLNVHDWPVFSLDVGDRAPDTPCLVVLRDANRPELDLLKASLCELGLVGGRRTTWIGAPAPIEPPTDDLRPLFVNYYTLDTPYAALADRLRDSLDRFGLDHEIVGVDARRSWEANCAMKAAFVRDMWSNSRRPVVWLDADATVEAPPILLNAVLGDFSISKTGGFRMGSGTIGFDQTAEAGELLERWVLRCEADPSTWDQLHLDAAWADVSSYAPLATFWLPEPYLHIFDHPGEPAVVTHWQASRTYKGEVSGGVVGAIQDLPESVWPLRKASRFIRNGEVRFWSDVGLDHVIPNTGEEYPEGFDVPAVMRDMTAGYLPLLDIGCGPARLAGAFGEDDYIGVDVNPNAIRVASQRYPDKTFKLITEESEFPEAASALFYTVLLHVSDEDVVALLAKAARAAKRILIAELMDPRWRRPGDPPVFNREPETYVQMMNALGYDLVNHDRRPYKRYDVEAHWGARDTRLTTLVFDRREAVKMKRSGDMWIRAEDTFIGDYFDKTGDGFEIDHLMAALEFCEGRGFALDVGAHYGSWTRHLARLFDRVEAFEPTPETYACLERNIAGFPNAAIHAAAVGERSGYVSVGPGKMYSHPGMETINGDTGHVPLVRLDDLAFPKVDFLKIDVEGYELHVLKGAEQLLVRDRPVIILEENIRGPLEHGIENGLCEAFLNTLGASRVAVLNKDFVFAWR